MPFPMIHNRPTRAMAGRPMPKLYAGACPASGTPSAKCDIAEYDAEGKPWLQCPLCWYIGRVVNSKLERHQRQTEDDELVP